MARGSNRGGFHQIGRRIKDYIHATASPHGETSRVVDPRTMWTDTIVRMSRQRFSGTLEAGRGGGAFVVLPQDVLEALGKGSRFRVTGTLNGVSFDSSTMGMGRGRVCLGVHKATREAAAVGIGDSVKVEIEPDTRPREVVIPDDLADALAGDASIQAAFERLSFTHRREYVEWVTGAKRDETRARRIAQTLDRLRA